MPPHCYCREGLKERKRMRYNGEEDKIKGEREIVSREKRMVKVVVENIIEKSEWGIRGWWYTEMRTRREVERSRRRGRIWKICKGR